MRLRALAGGLLYVLLVCVAFAQTGEARFAVHHFEIEGELPIPRERALAILAPFTGPAVDLTQLQNAAAALEVELVSRGNAFYRVVVPPQSLEGAVRIRVLPFRLASVNVSGNKYFSRENVLASLPALRLGSSPNIFELGRNRAAANEHATKQVDVTFRQSEVPDSVDAEVAVQDNPAQSVFIGLSNIGDKTTGRWRASLGYQHSNLWNRDHTVTATYATAPENTGDVKQYGFFYRVPFYSISGALTFFYAYSDVNSGTVAGAFQVSGRGRFAGVHWKRHLTPLGAYSHALELGLDDRFFDNGVLFGTTELGVDVRTRPITFSYQGRVDGATSIVGGSLQYVQNLGGGSDNSEAAYAANRAGASRHWHAIRYGADGQWRVAPWILSVRLHGQYSAQPLVPGEQFGFGGAASVRGLHEREVTGDSGTSVTVEGLVPLPIDGVYGVVFFDAAEARLKNPQAGERARQSAASVGLGLRWTVPRRFSLSLDLAQVIDGTTVTEAGDRRAHVSLIYRF